ncbi:MAG TPA: DUF3298 domain-containing protein [Pyrinomonadaceae bacterium]|nr:DUF3298 domain-containing protein [Pyrinomonadaceae bacterium]
MKRFLLILLLLAIALGGCRKSTPTTQQAPPPSNPSSATGQLAHPEGGAMAAAETRYFKGSIGSALGLQMKLIRERDKLTGSYFYQKIGTRIELKGSVDNNNQVALEESDSSGKQTGIFKGLWTASAEDGLVSIAGNWTRPDGQKQTAFSLHEEPIHFSKSVEVVAKSIKETNKKLKYEIDVEYPQLLGLLSPGLEKFNREAGRVALREVSEFKKNMTEEKVGEETPEESSSPGSSLDIGYSIALANDEVISILFDAGTYYRGAAHPNSNSLVMNFDVQKGRILKLADLFKPGVKYLQTLSVYAIKDLKRQSKAQGANGMLDDSSIASGAAATERNYQSWTITKKGLGITFDSYQVGPYAAGPQYVLVPYAVLKDMIEPNGVLAPFTKPQL